MLAAGISAGAGRRAPQQGLPERPRSVGVECLEKLHLAAYQQRDRKTVPVKQAAAGQSGKLRTWDQDACEVELIRALQRDCLARQRSTPDLAQQTDRLGQRKLLAREAGDEAAAANFPARFELTINA